MDTDQARDLLKRYNAGNCNTSEKHLVETTFMAFNEVNVEIANKKIKRIQNEVFKNLPRSKDRNNRIKIIITVSTAIAAAIALALGISFFDSNQEVKKNTIGAETILPVGNSAIITLANGKQINLSKNQGEVLIDQDHIRYADGSIIKDAVSNDYQTISTPNGGEYKIVLSDGTRVWLNAATVLRYPASFREHSERKVTLVSGEAYFEVAKDKKHPFIVLNGNQKVTVLGTHFNINTYQKKIKTTLLEGVIRLSSFERNNSILLSPGEAVINDSGKLSKSNIDTTLAIAWKNGRLKFKDANLETILEEAERWYDIDVIYKGKIPQQHLTGGISRKSSLATLLKLLKLSGIKFSLKDESGRKTLSIES